MKAKKLALLGVAGVVSASTLCCSSSVKAATEAEYTKDENVYVRMDCDGGVAGTYVVNSFNVTDAGEITDYGDYESIKNLTNLDEIEEDKDEYTFYADKGKFYYQGDIKNAELPWKFDIEYELDGKSVDEDELAGNSGDLEIVIKVKKNDNTFASKFFDAYMLQTAVSLDNELCEDIEAEGATIVDTGTNEQITFTYMPGQPAGAGAEDEAIEGEETEGEEGKAEDVKAEEKDKDKKAEEEKTEEEKTEDEKAEDENEEDTEDAEDDEDNEDEDESKDVVAKYVVKASVEDFEMDDITINGAPMVEYEKSFASSDGKNTRQTMFIMSAVGIEIPETEEVVENTDEEEEPEGNFIQQIIDRFNNRNA